MTGKCRKLRDLGELVRLRWRRARFRHGPTVSDTSGKVLCSSPYTTVREGICKLISQIADRTASSISIPHPSHSRHDACSRSSKHQVVVITHEHPRNKPTLCFASSISAIGRLSFLPRRLVSSVGSSVLRLKRRALRCPPAAQSRMLHGLPLLADHPADLRHRAAVDNCRRR